MDAALGVWFKIATASPICLPRIKSTTKRTLRGAIRTVLATAFACMGKSSSQLTSCFLIVCTMACVFACWSKFTKFMAYHIFCYVYGNVFATIVDCNCLSDKCRENCRTARPRFNHLFFLRVLLCFNFFHKMIINKRSFFQAATHLRSSLRDCTTALLANRSGIKLFFTTTHDELV